MSYAVIQIAGKQYKVAEGQQLVIDSIPGEADSTIEVADVLMTSIDGKLNLGLPTVKGAKVALKIVSHGRSKKLRVAKYKAKSRYRKVHGHRQTQTTVEVTSIK